MRNARYRPLVTGVILLAAAWLVAWGGYRLAAGSRMTAEKFSAFADKLELGKLRGDERAKALRDLADKLNRLPLEERRQVRRGRDHPGRLFKEMTEEEKGQFIEATMPTGFKQMLASFEQLPEDKRKQALERAVRQMRNRREEGGRPSDEGNGPREASPELQKKIIEVGLRTFYRESSAQTKAEVAPLLEEIQHTMESGRLFHP